MLPYLKRAEVKPGMTVRTYQLDEIIGEYVILSNTRMVPDENGIYCDIEGEIQFIGTEKEKELWTKQNSNKDITVMINAPYDGYIMEDIDAE